MERLVNRTDEQLALDSSCRWGFVVALAERPLAQSPPTNKIHLVVMGRSLDGRPAQIDGALSRY